MNEQLAHQVLKQALRHGVNEFCVCPGSRNAPFVSLLIKEEKLIKHYWFEERSAAYFALGRSRASKRPVAIITTSGTAAVELFPAIMEAHYLGVPLLAITADRPRRFRGTGAPQTAEQVGLFGQYVNFNEDLAEAEKSYLEFWERKGPAHMNVCFEEPLKISGGLPSICEDVPEPPQKAKSAPHDHSKIIGFFEHSKNPVILVSSLDEQDRESVAQFLLKLKAPVYLEGVSGLREDPRLSTCRISQIDGLWERTNEMGYPIDGILRIGGVPTARLWRDLEDRQYKFAVLSVNNVPFSGLSWGDILCTSIGEYFRDLVITSNTNAKLLERWTEKESRYRNHMAEAYRAEPRAEQSIFHALSKAIPAGSFVFLGNSLPIREWDLAADYQDRGHQVMASRGVCGIDGQISTFLGMCSAKKSNWAFLGDLTALYDMAGPWILSKLKDIKANLVVINNGGGKIFERMYAEKEFLNGHDLDFKPLADMWGLEYEKYETVPETLKETGNSRLIEIIPDNTATQRFWKRQSQH